MNTKFNITFQEFKLLTSVTIPPRPIARTMFWYDVIDNHYYTLTKDERVRLFEWINRCYGMEEGIKNKNEDCLLFNARFDPNNQYRVFTNFDGEEKVIETFSFQGRYYTKRNTFINDEFITKVEKI